MRAAGLALAAVLVAGCGGGDGGGTGPTVTVTGRVTDAVTGAGVVGARVIGFSEDAPRTAFALTDAQGAYALEVPEAFPVASVTLRVGAPGYQGLPSLLRDAAMGATDVALVPLPAGAPTGSIHGNANTGASPAGALIVAEGGPRGESAYTDVNGDYAIFNLPAGDYTVTAYSRGWNFTPKSDTLAAGADLVVDLLHNDAPTGTIQGTIAYQNAPGTAPTTVSMVVGSTYSATLGRGQAPPHLVDIPEMDHTYEYPNAPAGTYVVVFGLGNDGLVGMATDNIQVPSGGMVTADGVITAALAVVSPGAAGVEVLMDPQPTFMWADAMGEDAYDVQVFDAFGAEVWAMSMLGVNDGSTPYLKYGGDDLTPGAFYQFRATASAMGTDLSRTEDLLGVFQVPP